MKKIKLLFTFFFTLCVFSALQVKAFAEGTTAAAGNDQAGLGSLLPFVLMIGVFGLLAYFMIIRPDKKRRKEADDMRSSLKVGDNVTTIGGIIGTITSISGDTFTLDNGLKFRKTAIYTVDDKDIDLDDDDDDEKEEEKEEEETK